MEQRLIDANDLINNAMAKTFGLRICDIDDAQTILTIPDNPTNGDMVKAIFPDTEIEEIGDEGAIRSIAVSIGYGTSYFALDWWNAPYKKDVNKYD